MPEQNMWTSNGAAQNVHSYIQTHNITWNHFSYANTITMIHFICPNTIFHFSCKLLQEEKSIKTKLQPQLIGFSP